MPCEIGTLAIYDHPSNDVAAIEIDDHVQIEVRLLRGPMQFGYIPRLTLD
jgi:hypothetical protein